MTTYEVIQHQEVGAGGAASITFSSIPTDGTYTDLMLLLSLRDSSGATGYSESYLKPNASGSGYSSRQLYGNGSSAASFSHTDLIRLWNNGNSNTANTFGSITVYIPNYASSNYKSISAECVTEGNITGQGQFISASLWSNTAAISSLGIYANGSNSFVQYSSATLIGITAGSDGITSVA